MSQNPINRVLRKICRRKAFVSGLILASAVWRASATPVTVQEMGIDPAHETVELTSSTLGTVWAYAGIVNLRVNGVGTDGFCIDPFHWSVPGVQNYNSVNLSDAPKAPINGMGTDTALDIERLWEKYFSPTMSSQDAAGLQIAIWELVGGSNFKLDSRPDYGAVDMLNWLNNNPMAPVADLVAVTGPGQDYVVPHVPDGGATALLLCFAMAGLFVVRSKVLVAAPSKVFDGRRC